jgi:hypothetical protein
MPTTNRPRRTAGTTQKTGTPRSSKRIVNAVLFNPPDLASYLKLQNLLNYFVDCMNNLLSSTGNREEAADHLIQCIKHIDSLDISKAATINDELQSTLEEFIEDAHQFNQLVAAFTAGSSQPHSADKSTAVLLTAKASHLQWLSVCILEDLKKTQLPL